MYIMKRPSRGRGEYEIAEPFGVVSASQLDGKKLWVNFGPYGFHATGIKVTTQGGKLRLRIADRPAIHIQRQIQALLLFPKTIRDEELLPGGQPVIMQNRYILRRIVFGELQLHPDRADITISQLELSNGTITAEAVEYNGRLNRVHRLHQKASSFPEPVASLLNEHKLLLTAVAPLPLRTEEVVEHLMDEVAKIAPDYNIDYVFGTDVLVPLEEIIDVPPEEHPPDIAAIAPEEIAVKRREAAKWRRWVAARGAASAAFRRKVREAYSSRCIICDLRLPQNDICRVPGVDSAHILPWAAYDLDIVGNGLCLCKTHHWAFDQQFLAIIYDGNDYKVEVTLRAENAFQSEGATLAELRRFAGTITAERLPASQIDWPRAQFLNQLYADVPAQ